MQTKIGFYRRIARIVREEVLSYTQRLDTCIATTRVMVDVFNHLGVQILPLTVELFVGNPAFTAAVDKFDRFPDREELQQWRDQFGAHTVGVGFGREVSPHHFAGHLVAIVPPTPAHELAVLIDASIDQVNRPAKDIVFNNPLVVPAPLVCENPWSVTEIIDGRIIRYDRKSDRAMEGCRPYTVSPDWKHSYKPIVKQVLLEIESWGHQ